MDRNDSSESSKDTLVYFGCQMVNLATSRHWKDLDLVMEVNKVFGFGVRCLCNMFKALHLLNTERAYELQNLEYRE